MFNLEKTWVSTKNRIFLALLILLVFAANSQHITQQGTINNCYVPLAESIIAGDGYTFPLFDGLPATYPLWGYSFLVAIDYSLSAGFIILLAVQAFLAFVGIYYFYKIFELRPRPLHFLFLIPFIALMSVKWPDAIAGFLILPYIYYSKRYFDDKRWATMILSGIFLGILVNFRSEFILLPIMQLGMIAVPVFWKHRKGLAIHSAIVFAITIVSIAPWAVRYSTVSGQMGLTSSNGGAVVYISLGQLPGNPWGIVPLDRSAFDYARSVGIDNPYSAKGDSALKNEFTRLVSEKPMAYLKKCGYNLLSVIRGGVYTGEYASLAIDYDRRYEINDAIRNQSGMMAKADYLFDLPPSESISIVCEKVLQFAFVPVMFWLLFRFAGNFARPSGGNVQLFWLLASVVIYKLAVVSLVQYEYRHINAIYLLLLGIALSDKFGRKRSK